MFTSWFSCFQTYDAQGGARCSVEYPERLRRLKLYSLERRRERFMIMYIFKIIIGAVPNPGLSLSYNDRTLVKVTPKLGNVGPNWLKKARQASFFCQGPLLFNQLPRHLRNFESEDLPDKVRISSFKTKLDRHLKSIPDIPGNRHNTLLPTD